MTALMIIAEKEFRDGLRNHWVVITSLIFAVLAIGIAYFGSVATGKIGFPPLSTTIVSLSSLAVFVIPLIALMLCYDGLVGEDENGTLLLLLSYPLGRCQLLLGKMLGNAAILAVAIIVGFGSATLIMGLFSDTSWSELIPAFAIFIASSILLGWIFIAFAYAISATAAEKSKAAGMALLTWFLFVLVFDLGLLGVLVGTQGQVDAKLFPYLLLLNPTDIFRLLNISYFAKQQPGGLMAIASHVEIGTIGLFMVLTVWLAVAVGGALWLFKRKIL